MNHFYCDGMCVRDEYGRQRIFRGVNICLKLKDANVKEAKKNLLKEKLFQNLKASGVNIVRLGITWATLEEQKGKYSRDMAEVLYRFAKRCEKENIYVMPDMHQDLFSHYFHGDGAPGWAVDPSTKSKKQLAIWAEGYFYMSGVQRAFADFWENKNGVQDRFFECWRFLKNALNGCDNIIGYDFFNEPYLQSGGREVFLNILSNVSVAAGGNIDFHSCFTGGRERRGMILAVLKLLGLIKSPAGFSRLLAKMNSGEEFARIVSGNENITARFNETYYQPFFERACREIGGDLRVFEHNYYSNLGIPFRIRTPENAVYSPHAYDLFVDSPLYNRHCSNNRLDFILGRIRENQLKMNVPVIMGEWGGISKGENSLRHIEHIMDVFETYQWSSVYWGMNFKRKKLVDAFNRPYPAAVCGDIEEIRTDSKRRKILLHWTQQQACSDDSPVKNIFYIPGRGFTEYTGKQGNNRIEINY